MESAYVLANRELEEIRSKNKETQASKRADAISKAPRLAEIEIELAKCGTQLLDCVLNKRSNFEEIKDHIRALQSEKISVLEKNGFSADFLDDIYSCNTCRDTGFVDGHRCQCLKSLILKHIGANANLADYMKKQTFENFDFSLFAEQKCDNGKALKVAKVMCEKAMQFADSFDETQENLFLSGNAGTGKTYISSCIANRALERGKSVYYQTAYKFFEIFEKDKFLKDEFGEASETIKYIYDVDLLIIDDLGTEFTTQFTSAAFFDVINSRIISGKSTVISTNLDFESLSKTYSQRITSRFIGNYNLIHTFGDDLRSLIRSRNKA